MWSISLLSKERHSSRNYTSDHFGHIGVLAAKHKYALIGIAAGLAAIAIVIAVQHAAVSMQNSAETSAKVESTTATNNNDNNIEESTPVTVESNITSEQLPPAEPEVKTEVKVNNQPVPVPENGSVQKTIVDDNGTTSVNISVNSNTKGTSRTNSSTTFELDTKSETEAVMKDSD